MNDATASPPPATSTPRPAAALVPPRPNPGPELIEGPAAWPWTIALAAAGFVLGLVAWAVILRRRRGRRQRSFEVASPAAPTEALSPSEAVIMLAIRARESLNTRLGEHWRARTTEEVAADPALAGAFGATTVERLVALLRRADLIKFARPDASTTVVDRDEVDQWAAWVEGFAASAGASSTISGK